MIAVSYELPISGDELSKGFSCNDSLNSYNSSNEIDWMTWETLDSKFS